MPSACAGPVPGVFVQSLVEAGQFGISEQRVHGVLRGM
jgi:hypothetical protein